MPDTKSKVHRRTPVLPTLRAKRDPAAAAAAASLVPVLDKNYSRRRRTTFSGPAQGQTIEPLSTQLPLAVTLPRMNTPGMPFPNANKRMSLPSALDTSSLARLYAPSPTWNDAYSSEPPDSAATSSYAGSRRGSFDPPFDLESQPVHVKDLLNPYHQNSGFSVYGDGAYNQLQTLVDGFAMHPGAIPASNTRRPSSSRSISGGSTTSSSSGRGSFDGIESAPASGVSGSFPLFHGYPSSAHGSPYSSHGHSHPHSASSSSLSFSPHPSPPHHVHQLANAASESHMRAYDVPHSAPPGQFSFDPQALERPARRGGLRGWVDNTQSAPSSSSSMPAPVRQSTQTQQSYDREREREREVMAAAMTGGQPHQHPHPPILSLQIPTSDTRGHRRPSPLSLSASALSSAGGLYDLESPGLPPPVAISRTATALAMPVPQMPVGMPLELDLGMEMDMQQEGMGVDACDPSELELAPATAAMEHVDEEEYVDGYAAAQYAEEHEHQHEQMEMVSPSAPLAVSRTVSADAVTLGMGGADRDGDDDEALGGVLVSPGRARAATVSGPVSCTTAAF
uniref:Uncharacterized protein n=1 Tax=Mycena chlorophos TaxID=658473 RepID=A0ABQ0LKF6_MYCCL|nr:predicted protein [Mycena chlorophos]